MSAGSQSRSTARVLSIARVVGYFVYVSAFLLPAIREPGHIETYKGAFCAWVTLINSLNPEFIRSKYLLAIFSGWINPLMILYVAFLFSARLRSARRIIAALVLLFMAGTWVFFFLAPMVPLIGHFLWIAGILMVLSAEPVTQAKPTAAGQGNS